jgi:hypothetical protein
MNLKLFTSFHEHSNNNATTAATPGEKQQQQCKGNQTRNYHKPDASAILLSLCFFFLQVSETCNNKTLTEGRDSLPSSSSQKAKDLFFDSGRQTKQFRREKRELSFWCSTSSQPSF